MAIFKVHEDEEEYNPFENTATPTFTPVQEEQDSADSVIDELNEANQEAEEVADLSDVELRLEEANCFKALLINPLFGEPCSPIAKKVENRVRSFIRTELKALLGLEAPEVKATYKSPFSQAEETALKMLASKVLEKERPASAPTVTPVPQVATVKPQEAMPVVNKAADPTKVPVVAKPVAQPQAKPKPKGRPKKDYIEVERIVNGNAVKQRIEKLEQTKPPEGTKRHPPMTPEQQMAYISTNMVQAPSVGIVGKAVDIVMNRNNNGE